MFGLEMLVGHGQTSNGEVSKLVSRKPTNDLTKAIPDQPLLA